MIPIEGLINLGIDMYSVSIPVYDYQYVTTSGRDTRQIYGSRTAIQGAVDPSSGKNLERIFGGSISDGDIMIITSDILYIADDYDPDDSSEEQRLQSFIGHNGLRYRVKQEGQWEEQAGCRVYLCGRHLAQDDL